MIRKRIFAVLAMLALWTAGTTGFAQDLKIALVVKSLGNDFFDASSKGALEAAAEIGGIEILYTGPENPTVDGQIEIILSLIGQKVDGIIISANDPHALILATRRAMNAGIHVMSYDSAIHPDGRTIHLAPSDSRFIGYQQMELMGRAMGYSGDFAIVSASFQATNQNEWIWFMKKALEKNARYKKMNLVAVAYGDDQPDKSYRQTLALLRNYPNLKGIDAPTSVGLPASCKAVIDENKVGSVYVTGLGLPSEMAGYIKKNAVKSFALWNPVDLGYSAVYIMKSLIDKKIAGNKREIVDAGRMGKIPVRDDGLMVMGEPFVFNATNIDHWASVF